MAAAWCCLSSALDAADPRSPAALASVKWVATSIAEEHDDLPLASVHQGTPLRWRVLAQNDFSKHIDVEGVLAVGHFNGNRDEQVATISTEFAGDPSSILEVDGSRRSVPLHFGFFMPDALGWDFDGDGIDEIVPADSLKQIYEDLKQPIPAQFSKLDTENSTPIFGLDGSLKAVLLGGGVWTSGVTGDFDGDGKTDLALPYLSMQPWQNEALCYSTKGRKLGAAIISIRDRGLCGDVDGDGRDELSELDWDTNTITWARYDQPSCRLAPLPRELPNDGEPGTFDMTGDGWADIVFPDWGYVDSRTGAAVPFRYPPDAFKPSNWNAEVVPFDLDNDGLQEAAVLAGHIGPPCGLYIFNNEGQCCYYEEFNMKIMGVKCVHAKGREYLVIAFGDEIIIYP